jgi:hypothetical protein
MHTRLPIIQGRKIQDELHKTILQVEEIIPDEINQSSQEIRQKDPEKPMLVKMGKRIFPDRIIQPQARKHEKHIHPNVPFRKKKRKRLRGRDIDVEMKEQDGNRSHPKDFLSQTEYIFPSIFHASSFYSCKNKRN